MKRRCFVEEPASIPGTVALLTSNTQVPHILPVRKYSSARMVESPAMLRLKIRFQVEYLQPRASNMVLLPCGDFRTGTTSVPKPQRTLKSTSGTLEFSRHFLP